MTKTELRIRYISGGIRETRETGEYPSYYLIRSRKYRKSWKLNELPAELKHKGTVVYSIEDEMTIYDREGNRIRDVEYIDEMRD